ncbi:hypothetical protein [Mycobacterium shigaense]|uniref:Uncharacterized protein n=1 Tax=Mycobacterium shigaense TaxID=722731 RepID=A0A1Z4EKJ5_9MYCO|nr:hypothetical protein [Mycobacterium shigaense]MEA1123323.1 hypothetical protein [Mycobacterium shigaense]PRI15871.1 hypothetical protein B2J96_08305 [Mycobacterium shigaense]BAX93478.1 hypothetical protein MSG_03342 [Mycobacterium shigaense]
MTTLADLRQLVRESEPADWHKIDEGDNQKSRFDHTTLVYKPDIDLTICYGLRFGSPSRSGTEFGWSAVFPDNSVLIASADVFWRGSLVDRVDYANVDGCRAILPIGTGVDGLDITSWDRDAARVLHCQKNDAFGAFSDFYDQVPFRVI